MEQRKVHGVTRRIGIAGMLGISGALLAGCSVTPPENKFFDILRMGWPKGVTPEATQLGNFWVWVWVAAWIIGGIMWGLLFFAMGRWSDKSRARRGDHEEFPKQVGYNVPLELVLTTIPVLIVMTLFFFNVQAQDQATALDKADDKELVKVDVTGFQWNWKFGYDQVPASLTANGQIYKGTDEVAQAAAEKSKKIISETGEEVIGPIHGNAKDDRSYLKYNKIETVGTTEEVPVLVLPVNTPLEFNLAAADVVHSFWVPEFLFKRDVFPHPEANQSERRFQISEIEQEGEFVGRCAEMCGTYHAMMNFEVRAVSKEQFKEYIKFREANPEAPNSAALEAIGEPGYAITTNPFHSDRTGTRESGQNYNNRNA